MVQHSPSHSACTYGFLFLWTYSYGPFPLPLPLFLWISFSFATIPMDMTPKTVAGAYSYATIPMDVLFLCHYSYGHCLFLWTFPFPVQLFLWISSSCATIPMDLSIFLWTFSLSCATIPMDLLFLCHYSYGHMAYSYGPFPLPVLLFPWMFSSCATLPMDL